ncbi:MAG: hypothetical protein K0U25_06940 [Actinomycetia bacterium]|nr:hypothetical protein [Actinomycetes bacterium]NKB94625.1 hypothetical protein [Candidatus Nanopelagicales bacterium]
MSNIDDNVVPVLYALMALEQDVTISELAVGAQNRSMPEADTETPEWFAAATESVDLLAMAPELREIPEDSSDGEGLDIIGVYAPEMSKVRQTRPAHTAPAVGDVAQSPDVDEADTAVESDATAEPELVTAEFEVVAAHAPDPVPDDVEEVEADAEAVNAAAAIASPGPLLPEAPAPASKDRKPSQFDLLKELGDLSE